MVLLLPVHGEQNKQRCGKKSVEANQKCVYHCGAVMAGNR